jgi:dimethylaniline monooxygenase (N-oxide forming)
MSSDRADADPRIDEVSVRIKAVPERLWDLVSDVTRMGQWSPECFRCIWLSPRRSVVPGARFVGFNRRGPMVWATLNRVEQAERGRAFSFRTTTNGTLWSYRMEPAGRGETLLIERRDTSKMRRWITKPFNNLFLGGDAGRPEEMRSGMRETLERIKVVAEKG